MSHTARLREKEVAFSPPERDRVRGKERRPNRTWDCMCGKEGEHSLGERERGCVTYCVCVLGHGHVTLSVHHWIHQPREELRNRHSGVTNHLHNGPMRGSARPAIPLCVSMHSVHHMTLGGSTRPAIPLCVSMHSTHHVTLV